MAWWMPGVLAMAIGLAALMLFNHTD